MALSDGAIIAMARDANPEHDLTAMLPFLSRFAALVAAWERGKCATECESLSHRSRWLRDGEWRGTDLEPFIRLQLNTLWDAKIDAARAARGADKAQAAKQQEQLI